MAEGDNSEVSDNSLEVSPAKDMSISSADDGAVGGRGLKDDSVPSEGNEEVSQKQNDVGDSNEAPTDKPEGVAEAKEEAEEVNTEESKTEKEEGQEPEDIREPQEVINHHDGNIL